jgi:hypothetical protein
MKISAGSGRHPQYAMVFAGEHQVTIKKNGWTREQVQEYVFEHARISVAELKRNFIIAGDLTPEDERTMTPIVAKPQDLLVFAAGGKAGVQSAYIPGWGSTAGSQSVTKEIRRAQ